ncbi:unannotated protein [freshwater metagenome]|uniref:Unannotated protein n=1 Tax=freshwater metagenome TaxID=449393 RepID=A0A6J6DNC3_9ZZZZ
MRVRRGDTTRSRNSARSSGSVASCSIAPTMPRPLGRVTPSRNARSSVTRSPNTSSVSGRSAARDMPAIAAVARSAFEGNRRYSA